MNSFPLRLLTGLLLVALSQPGSAQCLQGSSLVLHAETAPGNQVRLVWNAPWPQSRWRVEQSQDPSFATPQILGETTTPQWFVPLASAGPRLFRVVPVDTLAAQDSSLVEGFEGYLPLASWPGEDLEPSGWALSGQAAFGSTSLHLFGNTVKALPLARPRLTPDSRFRITARSAAAGDRQMVGFADSSNVLWYVLWGTRGGYDDTPGQSGQAEVSAYQGFFPLDEWHTVVLEAGRDFQGKFGYLPELCAVILANETDEDPGEVWFDQLEEVSGLEARRPSAGIDWSVLSQTPDSLLLRLENPGAEPGWTHGWNLGDGRRIQGSGVVELSVSRQRDHRITVYVEDGAGAWQTASTLVPGTAPVSPRSLTMGFVGDIMTGRNYEEDGGLIETLGINGLFAPVADAFRAVDLMMGNAECAYTTADTPHPTKGIVFRTRPENAAGLVWSGLDFLTLANNHTYDYLVPGMEQTMAVFDSLGLPHNGAGLDSDRALRPVLLSADGLAVGVVSMCDRTGNYNNYQPFLDAGPSRPGFALWSRGNTAASVTPLRPQVDWLVLQVHSGNEYSTEPSRTSGESAAWAEDFPFDPETRGLSARDLNPDQSERSLRREAIEAGADLVITHHPHILQGFETHQDRLIAHSMGNFIMDLNYLETMMTAQLDVEVEEDQLLSARIRPAFIQDWVPGFVRGGASRYLLDHISSLSRDFDTWVLREPGDSTAVVVFDTTAVTLAGTAIPVALPLAADEDGFLSQPWFHEGGDYLAALSTTAGEPALEVRVGRELCWWGGMEDEGMSVWDLNSADENWDDTVARTGERSLRLDQQDGGQAITYFTHRGPLDPALEYTLGGFLRTQNAASADLQIRYYNTRTGDMTQSEVVHTVTGTQDWNGSFASLDPADSRRFWQLRARLTAGTGTSRAWFDDVHLVEWGPWQTLSSGSTLDLRFPDDGRAIQVRRATAGTAALTVHTNAVELPATALRGGSRAGGAR
jgi:poly-gamma-glutamate capsule biosynthesis protein CapA/YwtB (metallophosphatase superfamily)